MGLDAIGLQIGAWSGLGYLDGMAHWVCLRYFGCPIGAYEGGRFQCQCWFDMSVRGVLT